MKNKIFSIRNFVFIMLMLFSFQQGEAQLLQRAIKRGVNRAVERKVEKEAEKKTEEALDSMFKSEDKEVVAKEGESAEEVESRAKSMGMMQKMLGGINTADLPASFSFEQRVVWEVEDEKGEKTEMAMFFDANESNFGMNQIDDKKPENKQFIVMNFEDGYMAMFMDNDGTKQLMTIPINKKYVMEVVENSAEERESEDVTFEKTGKTKSILGYHCEEYLITTEDYIQHTWITQEVEVASGMQGFFRQAFEKNKKMSAPEISSGFPMEVEMIKKKNKKVTYMRTKSIDVVNFSIQTADYPAMNMMGQ